MLVLSDRMKEVVWPRDDHGEQMDSLVLLTETPAKSYGLLVLVLVFLVGSSWKLCIFSSFVLIINFEFKFI